MRKFTLRGYFGSVECPVLVTGAANSLYFDVDGNTTASFRELPRQTHKESTPGSGSLQAKIGALARCNQQALAFLDRQLGIVRAVSDRER